MMKRPPPECPKCGHDYGFKHSHPQWHPTQHRVELDDIPEYLEWACCVCGYRVKTPTADKDEFDA